MAGLQQLTREEVKILAEAFETLPEAASLPAAYRSRLAIESLLGSVLGYNDLVEAAREQHRIEAHGGRDGGESCELCGFLTAGVYETRTGRSLVDDLLGAMRAETGDPT